MQMIFSELSSLLCRIFCEEITVRPVPDGLAVSTQFADSSGDRITFYAVQSDGGWRLEDDGDYLANLVARDVPFSEGMRLALFNGILDDGGAYWDEQTLVIKTPVFADSEFKARVIPFLSALIRVRDLELLNRENVRSTFREDVIRKVQECYGDQVEIDEGGAVVPDFSEFPADLVLRPRSPEARPAAIYLVTSNDKLNEALLASQEAAHAGRTDFKVIGLIEDRDMRAIGKRQFQRATNRRLSMAIFRGDENSAVASVGRDMGIRLH